MLPPPTISERYSQGLFRLAGFGGALVILRSGVTAQGPTLDVGFLSPTDYVWFLRTPMSVGLSQRLATFFFDCANEMRPEESVEPVRDARSGLDVQVLSSSDGRVELQIQVVDDDDQESEDIGGLNFETSRVALVQAAAEVLVLENVRGGQW